MLVAIAAISVSALFYIDNSKARGTIDVRGEEARREEGRHEEGGPEHFLEARQRELFYASREGLQYGVPKQAIANAISQMREMERAAASSNAGGELNGASAPAATQAWNFIGPQPMSEKANFTGSAVGSPIAMTGRMTAVAADSHGLIVAGAASGGLWLSTNNGGNFVPVFDGQPTQAIGAIALDTTTTPSTIYVATGEGNNSIDSLYGSGMFKSSNLGQTWTSLGAAGNFDRAAFTSMAIDTQSTPGKPRIFAGATSGFSSSRADAGIFETDSTKAGLWFSSDGGNTWKHYDETIFDTCDLIGDGTAPCAADDVVIDPSNPKNVYVAIDTDAVYSSNDGGATFKRAVFPGVNFNQGRQSLAVGPSVPPPLGPPAPAPGGVAYAMIGAGDGIEYASMFASFDAGATWNPGTVLSPTIPTFKSGATSIDGTNPANFSQSFYDQALLVSPTDASTLFFGGVGLYKSSGTYGHAWSFLASGGGVHSDQHALTFDPANNQVLVANDGGLYMFDPTVANPTFTSLNQNISAGQIQGIGAHPTDQNKLIAGFQDNGTQLFSGSVSGWAVPDSETGDGGFSFYDQNDPNFVYHDFSLDEISHEAISASSDGGATWCSSPDVNSTACNTFGKPEWTPALQNLLNSVKDPGPVFYPPLAVDPAVAHRVLFAAHSVYVSTDGMATWGQQTDQDLTSGGTEEGGGTCGSAACAIEDLEFARSDHTHAWALAMSDLGGTVAFAVNNTTQGDVQIDATHVHGGTWNDVTGNLDTLLVKSSPAGVLSTQATSIAPDPHNTNVAYLGLSGFKSDTQVGHIFKTVDFGKTWTEADGGLPDVPVLKVLVDSTDNSGSCGGSACSNSIYAGTDIGVFHSSNGGTSWQSFNLSTLPAVPVYDIEQNSSGVIFIGTHGRGAFRLGVASVTPTPTRTATPTPTPTSTSKATVTATSTLKATPTATSTSKVPTPTPTPTATGGTPTTPTATPTPNGAKITVPTAITVKSAGVGVTTTKPASTKPSFTIKNAAKKGAGNLMGMVSLSDTSVFNISPGTFNLAPGKSQKESVTFAPTLPANTATATISSNDAFGNNNLTLTLSGAGLPGKLSVPKTLNLSGKVGTTVQKNLTIKNSGKGVLTGSWSSITTPPFMVTGNTFGPILPGKTQVVVVSFSPTSKGKISPVPLTITITGPFPGTGSVSIGGTGK